MMRNGSGESGSWTPKKAAVEKLPDKGGAQLQKQRGKAAADDAELTAEETLEERQKHKGSLLGHSKVAAALRDKAALPATRDLPQPQAARQDAAMKQKAAMDEVKAKVVRHIHEAERLVALGVAFVDLSDEVRDQLLDFSVTGELPVEPVEAPEDDPE